MNLFVTDYDVCTAINGRCIDTVETYTLRELIEVCYEYAETENKMAHHGFELLSDYVKRI